MYNNTIREIKEKKMPKDYIDFDTFKAQHNVKPRYPRCPRCKKPMESVMTNKFGKVMCADCFNIEVEKMEAAAKRRQKVEKDEPESEDTFTIDIDE